MHFSALTGRIGGDGVNHWSVHYQGMARLNAGEDIILLSVGQETQEQTPEPVRQAAIDSINSGRHHYTPVMGELRLRRAIARHHFQLSGQQVSAEQITVFAGAQNALFSCALCLLQRGDEVMVLEPYYVTYPATFTATGAQLVAIVTTAEQGFQPDIERIAAAITPATKALVINSPNNPTGVVYTAANLQAIVDLCRNHNIWIISDEVYAELTPDHICIASLPGAHDITITVGSLSKSHRMTGWRCGWTVAPPQAAEHFTSLCMCMSYGLPPFIQDAAAFALEENSSVSKHLREVLYQRYHIFCRELNNVNNSKVFGTPGGMFVVVDIRHLAISSQEFAQGLLDQHNIAILPCDGFGASGKGLLRVSLCEDDERIALAAQKIVRYMQKL